MIERALLDTSVLVDTSVAELESMAGSAAVSLISVAELQYGLAVAGDVGQLAIRRRRLDDVLEMCEVIRLDLATTKLYGSLVRLVLLTGRQPRSRRFDLLIAASAARHGIPILTRNPDDLRGLDRAITVVPVG